MVPSLTTKQVADRLGISTATIILMRHKGYLRVEPLNPENHKGGRYGFMWPAAAVDDIRRAREESKQRKGRRQEPHKRGTRRFRKGKWMTETDDLPTRIKALTDAHFKWGINPPTFDMGEARRLEDRVLFWSSEEEKRLVAALRVIATFPVTDPKSNMDAYNMGKIAREALGIAEA